MKQAKFLLWILVIVVILLGGCELIRQEAADIEPYTSETTPPAPVQTTPLPPAPAPTETITAPTAIVRIKAVPGQLKIGELTTAEISVETGVDVSSLRLTLQFSPAQLQLTDWTQYTESPDIIQQSVDNAAGIVQYSVSDTSVLPPVEAGVRTVAQFTLQATGEGISLLQITQLAISANDVPVAARIENAQINIQPQAIAVTTPPASPPETAPPAVTGPASPVPPTSELAATPPSAQPAAPMATTAAPPPPPLPPIMQPIFIPPGATIGFCYRVQPGETIETVCMNDVRCQALPYRPSPHDINRTNDLEPPYYLRPQQTIFIPTIPGRGPNFYKVQLGDTLDIIAERCKLPVTMLAKTNCLAPDSPLYQPAGSMVQLVDGTTTSLTKEAVVVDFLEIPVPPFPPPSRYNHPAGPIPIIPYSEPYPIHRNPLYPCQPY